MATTMPIPKAGRLTYSCVRCANRKVKCDRQRPCSGCIKHQVDCVYNIAHSPRKKAKRIKVKALTDQLSHYQDLLQQHGIQPSQLAQSERQETSRASEELELGVAVGGGTDHEYFNKTQMIDGQVRFRFVENSLWTRVVEESHDAGVISDDTDGSSDEHASEDDIGLVFRHQAQIKHKPRHPSSHHMQQLWKIFIENVDPLTKIVHVPTLQPAFLKASEDVSRLPRNLDALMFSIYVAALATLRDEECKQIFDEPRSVLFSKYASAAEAALSRANFMATTNLVVLQALLLYLAAIRDSYEPRTVFTLTGVAVRIAQVMGLERDGDLLGLPPFEAEIRRRVWWQLKLHDVRTAELCGLAKFRDIEFGDESTKYPRALDDGQLYPSMTSLPDTEGRITDTVIFNMRCELLGFASKRVASFRKEGKGSSKWHLDALKGQDNEMENNIKELENIMESKYVRYCDPSQPLHLLAMLMARYAMNVVRFLTHHPRSWTNDTPNAEREEIWNICIKLLEQHSMTKTNPMLKRFAWHSTYFQQWHAFIHTLEVLRTTPLHAGADRVWDLIASIYDATPAMVLETRKPIYVAIGNLCLKAYSAREAALSVFRPTTPNFIQRLREKREEVNAKRHARDARMNSSVKGVQKRLKSAQIVVPQHQHDTGMVASQSETPSFEGTDTMPTDMHDNPFSFLDEFNAFESSPTNNLDMELDALLAVDYGFGLDSSQAVPWEQWDTWLSESNSMRPMT